MTRALLWLALCAGAVRSEDTDPKIALPQAATNGMVLIAQPVDYGYRAELLLPVETVGIQEILNLTADLDAADPKAEKPVLKIDIQALANPGGNPRKALVRVKEKSLRPGQYAANLRLQTKKDGKWHEYPLMIQIPPAELNQVPPAVQITVTRWRFWECGDAAEAVIELPLAPANPVHWLTGLRAEQSGPFLLASAPHRFQVEAGVAPVTAYPRDGSAKRPRLIVKAPASAASGFWKAADLSGQVRIMADQLEKPVSLPVNVRVRISSWLLVPVIVLGILLGQYVRVRSERRLNLLRQRALSFEVLAAIRDTISTSGDRKLKEALTRLCQTIEQKLDTTAADLKKATDAADAAAKKAVADHNTAVAGFVADAKVWDNVLNQHYVLPAPVAAVWQPALQLLKTALRNAQGDLSEARKLLQEGVDKVRAELPKAVDAWSDAEWKPRHDAALALRRVADKAGKEWIDREFNPAVTRHTQNIQPLIDAPEVTAELAQKGLPAIHELFPCKRIWAASS
ncbi:MAG: hypothetical protein IT162_07490 [Bryobacterales bacterium]|nr:hypothetical protein [Bryobacterales bacterium]